MFLQDTRVSDSVPVSISNVHINYGYVKKYINECFKECSLKISIQLQNLLCSIEIKYRLSFLM